MVLPHSLDTACITHITFSVRLAGFLPNFHLGVTQANYQIQSCNSNSVGKWFYNFVYTERTNERDLSFVSSRLSQTMDGEEKKLAPAWINLTCNVNNDFILDRYKSVQITVICSVFESSPDFFPFSLMCTNHYLFDRMSMTRI